MESDGLDADDSRAVTPLIGNILLVGVVVVVAIVLVVLSFAFLEGAGTPTAEASFEYEQTPAGLRIVPKVLGTDVLVKLNGDKVATIESNSAGQSVLLPTAPGDQVTIVSKDRQRSVLVDKEIDERSEVGDLIAYYNFDQSTNDTVVDGSGNGNSGTIKGSGATRVSAGSGTALEMDGSLGTHVDVGDLTLVGPDSIDEMTIAITYEHHGGSNIQNLIEHQDSNFAWYMETDGKHGDPHQMEYNIGYRSAPNGKLKTGDVPANEPQVLVGTYDGDEMVLYRNGTRIDSTTLDRNVALGEVILGADSDPNSVGQNLDGRLYEVRMYYTAMSDSEVAVLSNTMEE